MCLYPTTLVNPKYKNQKINPAIKYVTAKCGKCIECRQAKAREWQQRLEAECENNKQPHAFITLTVSNETALKYGIDYTKENPTTEEFYEKENSMIKKEVQKWRHKCEKNGLKKKQFLITEHGEDNSYRIHVHGIIWSNQIKDVVEKWKAGRTDIGTIRDSTISYIVKYIHKTPERHKNYKSIILVSPGIGNSYTKSANAYRNRWRGDQTDFTYRLKNGTKIALCDYYMKKLYTENQLLQRRIKINEEGKRWVFKLEYNIRESKQYKNYIEKLAYEQKKHPRNLEIKKEKQ